MSGRARVRLNSILPAMKCGDIPSVPQRGSDATYCAMVAAAGTEWPYRLAQTGFHGA